MVKSYWSLACGFVIACMASQSASAQSVLETVLKNRGSHPVRMTSAVEEVPAPPALIDPDDRSTPIMHAPAAEAASSCAPVPCAPVSCVPSAGCAAPDTCHPVENGCAAPTAECVSAPCASVSCIPTSECAAPEPCHPLNYGCAAPATTDCSQYHANACHGGHVAAPGTCYCSNGCPESCRSHSCFDCMKKGCCCCCGSWCHTTGDLYPHFAYRPAYHGNYYFRPYNYSTIYEQRGWAAQLGAHPANPYSVSMFKAVNEDAPEVNLPVHPIQQMENRLPNLEDLVGVH